MPPHSHNYMAITVHLVEDSYWFLFRYSARQNRHLYGSGRGGLHYRHIDYSIL